VTVAEQIKRNTKPLTENRDFSAYFQAVKMTVLMSTLLISSYEYQFIDGSRLTCRVYW
jgi:hypothetical protein